MSMSIDTNRTGVICQHVESVVLRSFSHHMETILPFQLFLRQLSVANITVLILRLMTKLFDQPSFVPEMLGGITLGPTVLGQFRKFDDYMFPQISFMTLDVYDIIGFSLFIFIMNVRVDLKIIRNADKLAFIIGLGSVFIPLGVVVITALYLRSTVRMSQKLHETLPTIAFYQCVTSFQVVSGVLADIKLLNSELGRLALSSSIISGIISWIFTMMALNWKESTTEEGVKFAILETNLCKIGLILAIVFVLRPILHWMVKQTPEGKPLKEEYFMAIMLMILGSSLFGEICGLHFLLGPVVLALVVPDGPPMGSTVTENLIYTVGVMLVPCYFINVGKRVNLHEVELDTFFIVVLIVAVGVLTKLLAVVIPSLYYKIPIADAVSLGFIFNWQGWVDILYVDRAYFFKMIHPDAYSVMLLTSVLRSAIFVPLVRSLYDPTRRYVAYRRRTVQHSKHNLELRILACVHEEEDAPSIIKLLDFSNSTQERPMGVYVLDLKELQGRASPILIAHPPGKPPALVPTRTDRIMNVFNKFESENQDFVKVLNFTAVAPYVTMHDDVCSLALDKEVVLIILPFTKCYGAKIRTVHKSVLEMAPCSVGILVSGEFEINPRLSVSGNLGFKVCMIFLGGPDDREALAFSARLASHPTSNLTVLRIFSVVDDKTTDNLIERRMDITAIEDFNMQTSGNPRIQFVDEYVEESTRTVSILSSLKNDDYNMILVGRRHDKRSSVLMGFAEWTEVEELGVVGDMLGSSDFISKFTLLVVQQQASVVHEMVEPRSLKMFS